MRRFLIAVCLAGLFNFAGAKSRAQAAKPAEKSAAPEANMPSEATVESFLQQQFGYQADVSWKISNIRPVGIAGLSEVTVILATPQGQQISRFYVTPDGEHA